MSEKDSTGSIPPLDAPTGEAKKKTNVNKAILLILVMAGILLIVGGAILFKKMRTSPSPDIQKTAVTPAYAVKNEAVENKSIAQIKADAKKREEDEAKHKAADDELKRKNDERAAAVAAQSSASSHAAPAASPASAPITPHERKMSSGVLVEYAPSGRASAPQSGSAPTPNGGASVIAAARSAGRLGNLDYLLKKGTHIPCVLRTKIDTTLPGIVVCLTTNAVYSANGKTLLIERGAEVFGEQQSSLKQGQARTHVLWTRIDNPSGISAAIDSPAADQIGASGVSGFVDTHFWDRFGGAIMLSLITDFSQAYASRESGGSANGTVTYTNTTQATQNMATETLRNTINIPPTLVVNPATILHVMVARDVSFEGVYVLK